MKNALIFLILAFLVFSCINKKASPYETVTQYYEARDASDYEAIKTYISDSITIVEGDYIMPYDQKSFEEVFKWDSIFQPSYELVELEERNNQILASVTLNSIRNAFLKNESMTCLYSISFLSGRISKIESMDCTDVDWAVWQKERDALVEWTRKNHPNLDGFINDMTMKGAINYLKAIELYQSNLDAANKER